jgi:hypothetical protein
VTTIIVSERNGWWLVQRQSGEMVATLARERARYRAVEYARRLVQLDETVSLRIDSDVPD